MADVNANIRINVETSQSLSEIKRLQAQLAALYSSINKGSAAAAAAQKGLATNLMNTINAGGKFYAQQGTIRTSTESFTRALERNKLTMREYFRYAGASTRTFGKLFKSEFSTISKVAEDRVRKMRTQYIKMGRDASGAMKAISVTPATLNMKEYGNQVAVAAQKQALLNQLLRQGSTNLLNFGKNTQWAGRQLMVGFSVPLMYIGGAAAKVFMDLEKQALRFKRVYGDVFTTTNETNKALEDVRELAEGFTKYGVAVVKTMEIAANAAAMGKKGADLMAQVQNATRLAVLGSVEQEQALETTISITNAFGIAAEDLTQKINFLNAVENQTVTSIEDLTIAIPKAGPVVKQLGGDVEDLAFFLTAMREGGINASEGANALKSGLASLINPTDKASKMLADMGINLKGIVEATKGDIKQTVIEFANALDTLEPLERSRAIEQLFGKFQFARLSTLFQNITKEGTQASRVLDLATSSVEELAILAERELKVIEDAVGTNFREAFEQLKLTLEPVGKEFLKALTPIIKFIGGILEKFGNLGDGTKKFLVVATTMLGIIGPAFLMTFGLVANGAANLIKLFVLMRQGFLKLSGQSTNLAMQTQYMSTEQMEAATVAASLNQSHTRLTQSFQLEKAALDQLRNAYVQATIAARNFALANPGMMAPGFKAGVPPIRGKFATGTTEVVGGTPGKDSVPSLLQPGEAVIPTKVAQDDRFKPLIAALVSGEIQKYQTGTTNAGGTSQASRGSTVFFDFDDTLAASKKSLGSWMKANGIPADAKLTQAQYDAFNDDVLSGKVKVSAIDKNVQMLKKMQRRGMDIQILSARMQNETNANAVRQFLAANGIAIPNDKIHLQPGSRFELKLGGPERDAQFKKDFISDFSKGAKGSKIFLVDDNVANVKAVDAIRNKNVRTVFSMPIKKEAKIIGRNENGNRIVEFNGKRYLTSDLKSALALTNRINGELYDISDEQARRRYFSYVSKRLDDQLAKPKNKGLVNVSNVFKQVDKPGGSTGFAANNPEAARLLRSKSRGGVGALNAEAFDRETIRLRDALRAEGLNDKQIRDFIGKSSSSRQASHLLPPGDTSMKWFAGQVAEDYPGLNNYLNRAKGADLDGAIRRLIADPALRQQLGYTDRDIRKLAVDYQYAKLGAHPTSAKDLQSIGRLAALETKMVAAGIAPKSMVDNIHQAKGVLGLLGVRDPSFYKNYYKRVVQLGGAGGAGTGKQITRRGLERISNTARAQALRAAGFMLAPGGLSLVTKGETMLDERGRPAGKVTGQNTKAKPAGMARVGGTSADSRAMLTTPGMGFGFPRLRIAGAGLNPKGAVPPNVANPFGATQAEIAKETRRTKKSIQEDTKARNENVKSTKSETKARAEGTKETKKQSNTTREYTKAQRKEMSDRAKNQPRDARGRFISGNAVGANGTAGMSKQDLRFARAQRMSLYTGGVAMAAGTAAMAGAMMGAPESFTKMMLGVSVVAGLLPLMANPIMLAIVAIGGLAMIAMKMNNDLKKAREAGIKLGKAMSMSADQVKELGLLSGKVSASEIGDKRRQNILGGGITEPQRKFGQNVMQSDFGKKMMEDVKLLGESGMQPKDIAKNIANQLGQAILQGVITVEQAKSIASAMGEQLGSYEIPLNISGNLNRIFGPNGENLAEDPLQVTLEVKKESMQNQAEAFNAALAQRKPLTTLAGGAQVGGGAALMAFGAGVATTGIGAPVGGAIAAVGAVITIDELLDQNKAKAENLKLDTAAIQLGIEAVAQGQDLLDSINRQYDNKIKQAKTQKEINDLEDKRQKALQAINAENDKTLKLLRDQKDQLSPGAFDAAIKASVDALYKEGPMSVFKDEALKAINEIKDSDFKADMQLGFASGDVDPITLINILKMVSNNENIKKNVQLLISQQGFANMGVMMQLINTAAQGDQATVDVMLNYVNTNEKTFDEDMEAMRRIADFKGAYDVTLDMKTNGVGKIQAASVALDQIESLPPKITKEALMKANTDGQFNDIIANWGQLSEGKSQISKNLIVNYRVGAIDDNIKKAAQAAGLTVAEYLARGFQEPTKVTVPEPKDDSGDKKGRDTHLDELLKRLKFIRDAGINAEKGVKELMRITSGKGLAKFGGVIQQLAAGPKGGFNREFISFLEGLDNKTRAIYMTEKKGKVILTEKGKALKEAFNEKVVGEFQVAQFQTIQDTKAQGAALLKLQAAGVDSATALEMVSDANLAVAINSKNITGKELRNMALQATNAKDEVKALNLEVLQLAENLKKDVAETEDTILALAKAREAGIVDPEILDFISKDMNLVNKIMKKGIDNETVQNILKSKEALKQLGEVTQDLINPAERAMQTFNKLKDAAFKVFDKQEASARKQYNDSMRQTVGSIKDAQTGMANFAKIKPEYQNLSLKDAIKKVEGEIQGYQDKIKSVQDTKIRPIDLEISDLQGQIDDFMFKLKKSSSGLKLKDGSLLPASAYDDTKQQLEDDIANLEREVEFDPKFGTRAVEQIQKNIKDQEYLLEMDPVFGNRAIKKLQDDISDRERELEVNPEFGARRIESLQNEINKLELEIELNFSRPIGDLQEESSDLSNELTLMDRVADQITQRYDAQAKALEQVSEINQEILDQQKSQLDIASAITQGDIAAAANAAQQARAQSASAAAGRAGGVLDAAREAEISALRSSSGMTRLQIEERQFQISQQIFALEEQSEIRQRAIRDIQDQIRSIEEIRAAKQLEIRNIQDQLYEKEQLREAINLKIQGYQDQILEAEKLQAVKNEEIRSKKDQIALGEIAREKFLRENVVPLETTIEDLNRKKAGYAKEIEGYETSILELQTSILDPLTKQEEIYQNILDDTLERIDAERQYWIDQATALQDAIDATENLASAAGTAQDAFEAAYAAYSEIKSKTVYIDVIQRVNQIITSTTGTGGSGGTGTGTGTGTSQQFKMYGGKIKGYMGGGKVKPLYRPMGGLIPYMANGGFKPMGSDTVPAMLTPGEYVVNKASTKSFLPLLSAMNESKYPSALARKMFSGAGDVRITRSFNTPRFDVSSVSNLAFMQPSYDVSNVNVSNTPISTSNSAFSDNSSAVYNYNVGISVGGTSASPDSIAKAVMREIKYIDSQRVRNQRAV